ncbi:helix-turn-helix domain-containing protein [Patescibacteria group bacterium]|nr:helix-turn-helix domain-containing protein [Patescibacteria group bacterium]
MRKLDRVPQRLGEKLRALRSGQAVSLDIVEKKTHIQKKYLIALENGNYENLPEPLYTRNFIRTYVRALNSDEEYFLELYDEECGRCDCVGHMRTPRQRLKRKKLIIWNNFLKIALASTFAGLFILYLGFQINSIIQPPEIYIFSPQEASTTSDATLLIEGLVEIESVVYVNGEQVVVNSDNTFKTEMDLEKGLNIIQIEAERRYSKSVVVERRVVFTPKSVPQVGFID